MVLLTNLVDGAAHGGISGSAPFGIHLSDLGWVEAVGWLVEDEDGWIVEHGCSDPDPLAKALAEVADAPAAHGAQGAAIDDVFDAVASLLAVESE